MKTVEKLWLAFSITILAAMVATPALVAAQITTQNTPPTYTTGNTSPTYTTGNSVGSIQNPLNVSSVCSLLKVLLNIALLLGMPIAILFIVYAGFKLVLARGNPTELSKARNNLLWTFVGIFIFVGVWTFVNILATTLGSLGVTIWGDCR